MSTPRRAAIVGTAESWKKTPFRDPSLYICSLNDAYCVQGPAGEKFERADEWWELHPFGEMFFRPKAKRKFLPGEIPEGKYVRPEGHLEWLKEQAKTIPVWLQADPPEDWPVNAKRFPVEALEAKYGTYWASGPAYMLMSLYDRGFRDIAIYGIHLATEHEYRKQRPNFEALIRGLIGAEVKERVADGLRYYEGRECVIALPKEAPILQHGWKYAYQPEPQPPDLEAQKRYRQLAKQELKLIQELVNWPRWKGKAEKLAELARVQAEMRDAKQQARHAQITHAA